MSTPRRWKKVLVVCSAFAAVPLAFNGTSRVTLSTACAQTESGGTCCPESTSHCYPNGCSSSECMDPNRYWRTDGQPCFS